VNILDENISETQWRRLHSWRIAIRPIGYDIGQKEMKDERIIPFLLQLHRPTFFTVDAGFYRRNLCHSRYCLVYYMDIREQEDAVFVRRLLRHPEFDTEAKRMGAVIRVSHAGLTAWRLHAEKEARLGWAD